MKSIKLIATLLALLAYGSGQAQTADDYAAVSEFLPAGELAHIQQNEDRFVEFVYLNKHGYYIGHAGPKDISEYADISEIEALYPGLPELNEALIENGELNLMGYNFHMQSEKFTYYRIGNGDKVLVIPPTNMTLRKLTSETE